MSGSCAGERERKKIDFMKVYTDLPETMGGLKQWATMKFFKGKIVFLLFGEVSKI